MDNASNPGETPPDKGKSTESNWPWFVKIFIKEWPEVKDCKISFITCGLACLCIGAFVAWWLGTSVIIAQKDATIQSLERDRDAFANRSGSLEKDNDKLTKQIEGYKTYRGQDAMPLKSKAQILARQIKEFTRDWKETDSVLVKNQNSMNYQLRFSLRASIMRDDLDQNGQQSDTFDKIMYGFDGSYDHIRQIATQIEALANKLPN